MKPKPNNDDRRRPRLKRETLRGLGVDELAAVHGGNDKKGRPRGSRFCLIFTDG